MAERYFDLNIGEFLEAWEVRHALREIIANAFDEHALCGIEEAPEIARDGDAWTIRDRGRGLSVEHLVQKESVEKLDHEGVIGRFGVGLKDALATLHRHGVATEIRTPLLRITFRAHAKAGFESVATLHAVVAEPLIGHGDGTEYRFRNVPFGQMERAQGNFLRFLDTEVVESLPEGDVLAKDLNGPAVIFVRGMQVATEDRFAFSYNVRQLTPAMKRALNRERTHVSRAAYADSVKAMLCRASSEPVVEHLVRELRRTTRSGGADELRWLPVAVRACVHQADRAEVVFATPEQIQAGAEDLDMAARERRSLVSVTAKVLRHLEATKDSSGRGLCTLDRYRRERMASYRFVWVHPTELSPAEREIFGRAEDIASLLGLQLQGNCSLRISETIRPDAGERADAVGLWQPSIRRIVVKRTQLSSLADFAGTLAHELIHATSGHGDVTRDFEAALTRGLGLLAARACGAAAAPSPGWPWHEPRRSTVAPPIGGCQPSLFDD